MYLLEEEEASCLSVSLGLYLFLSLSFHLSSLSDFGLIIDFFSFYVKIMFGFAFSPYVWLGLSLLPSSVVSAGNQSF